MKVHSNDQKRAGRTLFVEYWRYIIRTIILAIFVLISSILIVGFPSVSFGAMDPLSPEERAWLKEHDGKIIVNNEAGWPPIIDMDKDGNSFGIVMDYQRLIEKKLNFKFKIDKLDTWHNFMEKFRKGEIDVNNNLQKNPKRMEYALFTKPYIEIPNVIIVRKEIKGSLSLEKMRGMEIAVVKDFAINDYIKYNYDYLQLILLDDDLRCLLAVSTRDVDAAVVNLAVASFIIEKMGIANLRVAGDAGYTNALCFASRKDWPVLNRILEKGLNLITPAERNTIYKKWISLGDRPFYKTRIFWIIAFSITAIFVLIISIILVWNRSLKRQVGLRTEKLEAINIVLINEIDERKQAEEALRQSEEKYRSILETMQEGYFEVDFVGNFTFFNDSLRRFLGYSKEELMDVNYRQYTDEENAKVNYQAFNKVYTTGEPIEGLDWQIIRRDGTKKYVESSISLQIDSSGKPIGFRGIVRDVTDRKHAEEERQQTLERLKKAFGTIVQVMSSSVEAKDPYTAGHQLRVAHLACAIATEMGLAQDKIEGIRMAGSIHDIGKLSVPAEILSKPTKLTNIEFSLIKEHSQTGYDMLKDVESPWPLAQIVYQHHERMDGSGYPKNLKGDEILIEARILAVADVMEAMASYRPYRAALGIEVALQEIEKNKGIFYDDTVADACLRLFREKGYELT